MECIISTNVNCLTSHQNILDRVEFKLIPWRNTHILLPPWRISHINAMEDTHICVMILIFVFITHINEMEEYL